MLEVAKRKESESGREKELEEKLRSGRAKWEKRARLSLWALTAQS